MDSQILSFILEKNAFFYGGFVRDYLIRGEKFNDIDYDFHHGDIDSKEGTININNKKITIGNIQERKKIFFNHKYHYYHRMYYYDLSCNLFGFDKDGFFPLPCEHPNVDFEKVWQAILNKEFYILCKPNRRIRLKNFLSRNWKIAGEAISESNKIIYRDRTGIWQNYNEIAFERIKNIDKINK